MTNKVDDAVATEINNAVATEIGRQGRLQELGCEENDYGGMYANNCKVTFYSVFGEYEVDIVLPNGSVVGFDVPIEAVSGKTADEIAATRRRSVKP